MKTCKRCEIAKDPSEFGALLSSKDGLQSACRICTNKYQTEKRRARAEGKSSGKRPEPNSRTLGDGSVLKRCTRCEEEKDLESFYKRSGYETRYAHCKSCHNEITTEREKKVGRSNPEESRRQQRDRRSRDPFMANMRGKAYKYGISVDEAIRLSTSPCELCGTDDPGVDGATMFIDHNHTTGQVRGGLCRKCNFYVGWRENHEDLEEAYERYAKKYGKRYS